MGDFDKFMKSKNRNLYIGIGLIILLLVGALVWMYSSKRNAEHDLEEESDLIRSAVSNAQASQAPASQPKEQFTPPQAQQKAARPAIVVFHSNGCGHCTQLMPVWAQLRQQIGKEVDVMDFEASKEREILAQNGVQGVPDIRYYPKGFPSQEHVKYSDMPGANRQLDSLIRFAMSHGQTA